MIKKVFVGLVITIVFGVAVLGIVNATFAQEVTTDTIAAPETVEKPAPVLQLQELGNINQYANQNGECTGDCPYGYTQEQQQAHQQQGLQGANAGTCAYAEDGVCPQTMAQNQMRQQLGIQAGNSDTCPNNEDGTCTQDMLQTQARQQLHLNIEDGTCTGDMTQTQTRQGNRNGGK